VRTELQFDEAHVPRAVCITTRRAGFGSKLAWLARSDQPLVFVGRDDEDALEAIELAGAVGLRTIGGYLAGGMTAWREERLEVAHVPRMTVPELHEQVDEVQVLDVRERSEWDEGRIPGSVHIPYHDIDGIPEGIDGSRPIAAICGSGQRSAVAASLLQRAGAREVIHVVDGGVGTWARSGWPIEP
jgi:rhodanese-related sulfurtransferase